jgi:hypothetical protein
MSEERSIFEGWAILELMGHRRLGGFVQEQEIAGHGFLRIDVPGENGNASASQFYSPGSVYCLTPTTEEMARAVARHNQPQPVNRWELPQPKAEFNCPACGPTNLRVCSHCDEQHPCSCMDEADHEVIASRRGYEDGLTDADDF